METSPADLLLDFFLDKFVLGASSSLKRSMSTADLLLVDLFLLSNALEESSLLVRAEEFRDIEAFNDLLDSLAPSLKDFFANGLLTGELCGFSSSLKRFKSTDTLLLVDFLPLVKEVEADASLLCRELSMFEKS